MKNGKNVHKKPEVEERSGFLLRFVICAALFVLAWSVRQYRPELADEASRRLNAGPDVSEVIALFGESVSSRDAFRELWHSSVTEVFAKTEVLP